LDYAAPETRRVGDQRVENELARLPDDIRKTARGLIERVRHNERDALI
jgi:hypothetical protein